MAGIIFILCALTSLTCSVLLFRAFWRGKTRLLMWSGLCFLGLALNNALLYVDVLVVPNIDLSVVRTIPALVGIICLIYGLIMDTR
jgi:hypothetical protein